MATPTHSMRSLVKGHDWSATPLGPEDGWPESLGTTVRMLLEARHPMLLFWGPELIQFYNDAFCPSLGPERHPAALGQRARECWADAWPVVGAQIEAVMERGESIWNEEFLVPIDRGGMREEVYWTYGYSPVRDGLGSVAGVLVVVTETTGAVVGRRRMRTLGDLAARTGGATDAEAAGRIAAEVLSENPNDIPFAVVYLSTATGDGIRRCGVAGLGEDHPAAPAHIPDDPNPNGPGDGWPIHDAIDGGRVVKVSDADERFGPLPGGPWEESPRDAVVLPVAQTGDHGPVGALVVGVSPRRPLDADYRRFLELVADRIAGAVGQARSHEEVRRRAEELAARMDAELEAARVREETQKRMARLLMTAPVAISVVVGPDFVYDLANPRHLAMVGRTDIIGLRFVDAYPELGAGAPVLGVLEEVYRTGRGFTTDEFPIAFRDGDVAAEERYFMFSCEPVLDRTGNTESIVTVAVDVSSHVRARRTVETQAAELEIARALAEEASEAKSRFLATMSHELRTPLNAILGYSDLLQEEIAGTLTGGQHEQLDRIEVAARHLLRIIEEVLTFSRIEAGEEVIRPESFDVGRLVKETAGMLEPMARKKGLSFSCSAPSPLPATTDPGKVRQILLNLLGNAVKFTDDGSVRISAKADGADVLITVSDSGPGIPAEKQDRIFEAFVQLETTGVSGGTGLGLPVSRHLADLLGGDLTLESDADGSAFSVRIPLELGG